MMRRAAYIGFIKVRRGAEKYLVKALNFATLYREFKVHHEGELTRQEFT